MDRFLIKTTIGYPSHDVSVNILKQVNVTDRAATVHPVLTGEDVLRMRNISETVHLDDAILEYIVRLVEATRHNERIQVGSSMRGALALTRCARVWAASDNRGYVVPDDVKNLAVPVLAHRITLTAEATFAGNTPEQMIGQILEDVPAPTLAPTPETQSTPAYAPHNPKGQGMRHSHTVQRRRTIQRSLRRLKHRIKRLATSYVSPLGWAVAALAVASLVAFVLLGWHELLAMAVVFAVMLAAAVMLSLGNTSFQATIDVSSRRVTVSDTVKVDVCVDNPGRTPTTSARGDLPIGDNHERFAIPMLAAGSHARRLWNSPPSAARCCPSARYPSAKATRSV